MNEFIMLMPIIFTISSSLLLAWSIMLIFKLLNLHCQETKLKKLEKIYLGAIISVTIIITSLLFIFTNFAAFHMSTLILLEIWYFVFLCSAEEFPCKPHLVVFRIEPKFLKKII